MNSRRLNSSIFLATLVTAALTPFAQSEERLGAPVPTLTNLQPAPAPADPIPIMGTDPGMGVRFFDSPRPNGFLTGNHDFPNFMGFFSNPTQSIGPKAVTEIFPIFGAAWASGNGPLLAKTDMQVYGAGISIALSDRLSFGLNQGGYAVLHTSSDRERILANLGFPVPDRLHGGEREGWLNLGGFFQYTLIADVPRQFMLGAGLRWEAPSGATQIFQGGSNPAYLAPYINMGKEFGDWHFLAVLGYEFPAGAGQGTTDTFYFNVHLDRKIGWLFPFIEFNSSYHTRAVDVSIPVHHGVIDLGTFTSTGNLVTMAVGLNAVLVPEKLEIGVGYGRPIASQYDFHFNGLMVRMSYRY